MKSIDGRKKMIFLQKLEGLAVSLLSLVLFSFVDGVHWWYLILFWIVPDLSMIGYLKNKKWGAYIYNFGHHQLVGSLVYVLGLAVQNQWVMFAGVILLLHSGVDRVLGYGFKYTDDFGHTHLN